jgi:hypothetical protein
VHRLCLQQVRFPIRGGNWNNGSNAGLRALNLNNERGNANNNIGFRVALIYGQNFNFTELKQSNEQKEIITLTINNRQKYSCSSVRLVTDILDNIARGTFY